MSFYKIYHADGHNVYSHFTMLSNWKMLETIIFIRTENHVKILLMYKIVQRTYGFHNARNHSLNCCMCGNVKRLPAPEFFLFFLIMSYHNNTCGYQ